MKKYTKALLILVSACIIISSCKLNSPAPQSVNTGPVVDNSQTVIGITVNGTKINDATLTGTWRAATTTLQYYNSDHVAVSGVLALNIFTSVALSEQSKTAAFVGLPADIAAPAESYELSTTDNILYIKLSGDPFSRSSNSGVRITSLTASTMTWLAIDPIPVTVNGQLLYKAYQVTFIK